MGPRLGRRGNRPEVSFDGMPYELFQWGHVWVDVETLKWVGLEPSQYLFQWGHVWVDVETGASWFRVPAIQGLFQWGHVWVDVETVEGEEPKS